MSVSAAKMSFTSHMSLRRCCLTGRDALRDCAMLLLLLVLLGGGGAAAALTGARV